VSIVTEGVNTGTSGGITVTGNASANTKSLPHTIVLHTSIAAARILISLWNTEVTASGNDDYLVDISVDGVVKFANLALSVTQNNFKHARYDFPCDIPAGSSIEARSQCTRGNMDLQVSVTLISGTAVPRTITTYGASEVDSGGTLVDPGTVEHTKGAWVTITAACEVTAALVVTPGNAAAALGLSTLRLNNRSWLVDIAIGPVGSEVVKLSNLPISSEPTNPLTPTLFPALPFAVPQGTRIAARAQQTGNNLTATDRLLDITLYGIFPIAVEPAPVLLFCGPPLLSAATCLPPLDAPAQARATIVPVSSNFAHALLSVPAEVCGSPILGLAECLPAVEV
jgi:hypothetical protein